MIPSSWSDILRPNWVWPSFPLDFSGAVPLMQRKGEGAQPVARWVDPMARAHRRTQLNVLICLAKAERSGIIMSTALVSTGSRGFCNGF